MHPETNVRVSIVIPTRNSSKTIHELLLSLRNQTYLDFEVIIVDDMSVDGTEKLGRDYGARVYSIESSRTRARNIGIAFAAGEFVLNLDSDMVASSCLIEECVGLCAHSGYDALVIPEVNVGEGYWARCLKLEKLLVRGVHGYEGSRFVRKTSLDRIGGYDETLVSGEDYDVQERLDESGFRTGVTQALINHNIGSPTVKELRGKYLFYGSTLPDFLRKSRSNRIGFIRLCLLKWRVLIAHPLDLPGFMFLSLLAYVAQKS